MGVYKLSVHLKHLKKWYPRHRERVHVALLGTLAGFTAIIAGQMFYPSGKMLPGVSIDDYNVGGKETSAVAQELERRYDKATLTLKTEKREYQQPMKHVGIEVVAQPTVAQAAEYSLRERLVPFSFLTKISRDVRPVLRFDDERLKLFAQEIAAENNVAPFDANVKLEGDKAVLKSARPGKTYRVSDIVRALHQIDPDPKKAILTVKPASEPPRRTNEDVRPTLEAAQKIIDTPLALVVSGERFTVDKKTLLGWIGFEDTKKGNKLNLVTRQEAVKQYLNDLKTRAYRAAGSTRVTTVDGRVEGRVEGAAGYGVDVDKSAELIASRLPGMSSTIDLPLIAIAPVVVYDRTYTDTQAGLDALVADVAAEKGASITVIELGGQGRRAEALGTKQWHTASMYKLFVAYAVLTRVEAGQMRWDEPISYGKDVAACFEAMIVLSDNVCGAAFGDHIGWGTVESMMHGIGLGSTYLAGYRATTANDLALFLQKLETGTILNAGSRDRLLSAMRRQIYRSGIPYGTGSAAANKVGYIWGVRHDAGIVYAPGGTYIMAIMTPGLSWPSVADAARQVHSFMNR